MAGLLPFTLNVTGNHGSAMEFIGPAYRLLQISEEARARMGIMLHTQTMEMNGADITVTSSQFGSHQIYIDVTGLEPPPEKVLIRERILHCRFELTPIDMEWLHNNPYEGDPAYTIFHPINNHTLDEPIYIHFIYNIDAEFEFEIDDAVLPPDTSLDDAVPIVESIVEGQLVPPVTTDTGERYSPLTKTESLFDDDLTNPTDTGYLDKFPDKINTGAWDKDGYSLSVYIDLDGVDTNFYGKKAMHLMKDYYACLPLDEFDMKLSSSDEEAVKVKTLFETSNSVESRRMLIQIDASTGLPFANGNYVYPMPYNNPIASRAGDPDETRNEERVREILEPWISLYTPFTDIVMDFSPISFLGETACLQDDNHHILEVSDDQKKILKNLSFPSYSLVPYYFEAKDMYNYLWEHGWSADPTDPTVDPVFISPDEWDDGKFYLDRCVDHLAGVRRDIVAECLQAYGQDYDWLPLSDDSGCYEIYAYHYPAAYNSNDWLLMPFRADFWPPELDDRFTWSEKDTLDKFTPWACDWEIGGVNAHVPNRVILCVRSSFANQDKVVLSGQRKEYDIYWNPDNPDSYVPAGEWLPPAFRWDSTTHSYMSDPNKRGSGKVSTYDAEDFEAPYPLSSDKLPTYMTVKGDLVHVAFLSAIYAEANKEPLTIEDFTPSDRCGNPADSTSRTATTKRIFQKAFEMDLEYKSLYGCGVTVVYDSEVVDALSLINDIDVPKNSLPGFLNLGLLFKMFSETGVFGDDNDGQPKESVEAAMIRRVYDGVAKYIEDNQLDTSLYSMYTPVSKVKLEVNLFDRYVG